MEYYVFVTEKCNMSCKYCFVKPAVSTQGYDRTLSPEQAVKVTKYIKRDIESRPNNHQKNRIVFFGGEPLLACDAIRTLLNVTSNLNMEYWLYTNGLLLNTASKDILSSMQLILVSVDGDKRAHEKYRGVGTYERIIQNITKTKNKIPTPFLGRITIEETTDLYLSVTTLLNHVDHVYWQIVNKPYFDDSDMFIQRYKAALRKLFQFWLSQLQDGKVLNIIPFQAVANSLMNSKKLINNSFRCGSGETLQVIGLDGIVYECDEYIGTNSGQLGTIDDDRPLRLKNESHQDLHKECGSCLYSEICLGRCKKMLKTFNKNQIRIYCNLTRFLIELVCNNLEEIKRALKTNDIECGQIYTGPFGTEELP